MWHKDQNGGLWRTWDRKQEDRTERVTQLYERVPDSCRVTSCREATPAPALVPEGHVECLVKHTKRDETVEGSWTAGGTRELQRARADVETHEICNEDRAMAHEMLDEIGFQPM